MPLWTGFWVWAEVHDVSTSGTALLVENGLDSIPTPYTGNDSPCTTGTQDMTKYPDSASVAGAAEKLTDPAGATYAGGDGNGYPLFGHDITADGVATGTINYVNFSVTTFCHTIDGNGTVHQWDTAGVEQVD